MSGRFFLISPFMSWSFESQLCILEVERGATDMDMKKNRRISETPPKREGTYPGAGRGDFYGSGTDDLPLGKRREYAGFKPVDPDCRIL